MVTFSIVRLLPTLYTGSLWSIVLLGEGCWKSAKKEVKKGHNWDRSVYPYKVCQLRKAVIHIKIIVAPHHGSKYYKIL